MTAYYNEFDPYAAAWLRNLIATGLIAPGDVDERSITEVRADDLRGYAQCHFFAGIGGWSYALRLAGWPDDKPVWTGSCPCQPFSAAGKQRGESDERHLWPVFAALIRECKPPVVFGEQVASKLGREWLAGVRADLEDMAYAVGAADLCAAGKGAPHIRQRLFWLADADGGLSRHGELQPGGQHGQQPQDGRVGGLGYADDDAGLAVGSLPADGRGTVRVQGPSAAAPGADGAWSQYDIVHCTDGKARRFEPGSFPLAHGASFKLGSGEPLEGKSRVGLLRGYGNAIVPPVAAAFVQSYMEIGHAADR